MNDDIREIYRAIAIPFGAHYRRSQQFDPSNSLIRLPGVGQATNPTDVDLPRIQQAFTFLPGDAVNELRGYLQPFGNISGNLTADEDRKSTRLNSSHLGISYAVFCLKKKTI